MVEDAHEFLSIQERLHVLFLVESREANFTMYQLDELRGQWISSQSWSWNL